MSDGVFSEPELEPKEDIAESGSTMCQYHGTYIKVVAYVISRCRAKLISLQSKVAVLGCEPSRAKEHLWQSQMYRFTTLENAIPGHVCGSS